MFQSPSHRGDHTYISVPQYSNGSAIDVSIPFASGRPYLPTENSCNLRATDRSFNPLRIGETIPTASNGLHHHRLLPRFQSPSHRGDHTYQLWANVYGVRGQVFQSPSHRGDHTYYSGNGFQQMGAYTVSIPFASGRPYLPILAVTAVINNW